LNVFRSEKELLDDLVSRDEVFEDAKTRLFDLGGEISCCHLATINVTVGSSGSALVCWSFLISRFEGQLASQ
jgi:hypothetical protein